MLFFCNFLHVLLLSATFDSFLHKPLANSHLLGITFVCARSKNIDRSRTNKFFLCRLYRKSQLFRLSSFFDFGSFSLVRCPFIQVVYVTFHIAGALGNKGMELTLTFASFRSYIVFLVPELFALQSLLEKFKVSRCFITIFFHDQFCFLA